MGSLWDHFGVTLRSLWDHFGTTLGHIGVTLGSLWDDFGITVGSLRGHFGVTFFIDFRTFSQMFVDFLRFFGEKKNRKI